MFIKFGEGLGSKSITLGMEWGYKAEFGERMGGEKNYNSYANHI